MPQLSNITEAINGILEHLCLASELWLDTASTQNEGFIIKTFILMDILVYESFPILELFGLVFKLNKV